ARFAVIGPAGVGIGIIQKVFAGQGHTADGKGLELTILRHGDAAVEEQVAVVDLVQTALGVKEADVSLELFTVEEGAGQLIDEGTLFLSEGIGIVGVYSGEVGILHGISGAIDGDALILIVDLVQQQPVRHTKAGVA